MLPNYFPSNYFFIFIHAVAEEPLIFAYPEFVHVKV